MGVINAFADELPELARHLAALDDGMRQASLRRSVSTAYYALFHLLISEATLNWSRIELRATLGRIFEHGKMKSASEKQMSDLNTYLKENPAQTPESVVAVNLHFVAKTFVQLQQRRNDADYEVASEWSATDVFTLIDSVAAAFTSWKTIRDEPKAQA